MRSQTKRAYIVWGGNIINVERQTSQGDPKKSDILSEAHYMGQGTIRYGASSLGILSIYTCKIYKHINCQHIIRVAKVFDYEEKLGRDKVRVRKGFQFCL